MQLRWVSISKAEEVRRKARPMIDTEINASIIAADSGPHVCADDLLPRCSLIIYRQPPLSGGF